MSSHEVFVSYSSKEKSTGDAICALLERDGVRCWIAPRDILPGEPWEETIVRAIGAARVFVLVYSFSSNASAQVRREVARAASHELPIIPFRIEAVQPNETLEYYISSQHWLDAFDPPLERHIQTLSSVVQRLLKPDEAPGSRNHRPSRYSSAHAAVGKPVDIASPRASRPAILAMPFANLSDDLDRSFFAEGVTDEVIRYLTRFRSLTVIAGSPDGAGVDGPGASRTARDLGARYLLTGRVQKVGERVRVSVNLIDAVSDAQLWSEQFDGSLEDVFALQDRVARAVVGGLEPRLRAEERKRVSNGARAGSNAYELYLSAVQLTQVRNKANLIAALDLLTRSISVDPNFADAMNLAADCHRSIFQYGWSDEPEQHRQKGLELSRRAVVKAGDDAGILADAAVAQSSLGADRKTSFALIDRAIELNAASASVWLASGVLRMRSGDLELATQHIQAGLQLSPEGNTRLSGMHLLATVRFLQGDYAEAADLDEEYVLHSESPAGYAHLAACRGLLGQALAAREALQDSNLSALCRLRNTPRTHSTATRFRHGGFLKVY